MNVILSFHLNKQLTKQTNWNFIIIFKAPIGAARPVRISPGIIYDLGITGRGFANKLSCVMPYCYVFVSYEINTPITINIDAIRHKINRKSLNFDGRSFDIGLDPWRIPLAYF